MHSWFVPLPIYILYPIYNSKSSSKSDDTNILCSRAEENTKKDGKLDKMFYVLVCSSPIKSATFFNSFDKELCYKALCTTSSSFHLDV